MAMLFIVHGPKTTNVLSRRQTPMVKNDENKIKRNLALM